MKVRKPWHSGDYQARQRALMRTVRSTSRCWRCGRLLHEHRPHKDGRSPFWTAGHIVDSDRSSPLALEASTCNFEAGGKLRHRKQRNGNPTSRRWLDHEPPRRP